MHFHKKISSKNLLKDQSVFSLVIVVLNVKIFSLNEVWIVCVKRKLRLVTLLDWRGQRNIATLLQSLIRGVFVY